jgi:predicted dinucleotide-utilizing enzyme
MKKHPASLKVEEPLRSKLQSYANDAAAVGEFVVYEGSVRELCPLAPNNVNTMACAALAGFTLGFDGVKARLIADKSLEAHVIDIELRGPKKEDPNDEFRVSTTRINPAKVGAVTGSATYVSFVSSMLKAHSLGPGVHFC